MKPYRSLWRPLFAILLLILATLACAGGPGGDEELPGSPGFPTPTPAKAGPPLPGLVQAKVTRVVDGDTIVVLFEGAEYRVRYIGIDTPETKHPTLGSQPFGPEASQANQELVGGKSIWLEKDVSETDQYGRLLRYVYVNDLMVNEELLRRGLAQVATFPPDVKYVERLLAAQRQAREAGLGLWGAE